jgi:hypothetical protein
MYVIGVHHFVVIIETQYSLKTVPTLLSEEKYRFLQVDLLDNPDAGCRLSDTSDPSLSDEIEIHSR